MFKKFVVAVLCMFLMVGVAFANGVVWCPPDANKGNTTTIDNSIDVQNQFKNSFNKTTVNKTTIDNSKTTIDNSKTTTIDSQKQVGLQNQNGGTGNIQVVVAGRSTGSSSAQGLGAASAAVGGRPSSAAAAPSATSPTNTGDVIGVAIGAGATGVDGRVTTAEANNDGVSLVNNNEDKRDLIPGPILSFPDAKLMSERADTIKLKGSIFNEVKVLTAKDVSNLLNGSTSVNVFMGPDAKIITRQLVKQDFVTDQVAYGKTEKGHYIGSVYILSTGADLIALEALAARTAMDWGGTHIFLEGQDAYVSATGDTKGISLGASASGFAKGDDIAVAPGAMIGWSKAKASNETLPTLIYKVYTDDTLFVYPIGTKCP